MTSGLFCSVELATEIERAEAELMAACSTAAREVEPRAFARPVGGGFATYAGPDSPFTKVAGLGFADADAGEMDAVEAAYAELGVPVQVELSTLGTDGLAGWLGGRGYQPVSFENVLGRSIVADGVRHRPPQGVAVEPAEDLEDWLHVVVEASLHPDEQGLAAHEEFSRAAIARAERQLVAAGVRPYLARRDGTPAGGGGYRAAGRIAQLTGAATLVEHRRRGVQSALLAARLDAARTAGCELIVVTTQPGSRSQQNVHRAGFELLYARAILVKG